MQKRCSALRSLHGRSPGLFHTSGSLTLMRKVRRPSQPVRWSFSNGQPQLGTINLNLLAGAIAATILVTLPLTAQHQSLEDLSREEKTMGWGREGPTIQLLPPPLS